MAKYITRINQLKARESALNSIIHMIEQRSPEEFRKEIRKMIFAKELKVKIRARDTIGNEDVIFIPKNGAIQEKLDALFEKYGLNHEWLKVNSNSFNNPKWRDY